MSNSATWDPKLFNVTVAGRRITGFSSGTGYSSDPVSDKFGMSVGNNGLGAFFRIAGQGHLCTFELMATSNDNDFFSQIMIADDAADGVLVPIIVTQQNGRIAESGDARILRIPTTNIGTDIGVRVWLFGSLNYKKYAGGMTPTRIATTAEQIEAIIAAGSNIPAAV